MTWPPPVQNPPLGSLGQNTIDMKKPVTKTLLKSLWDPCYGGWGKLFLQLNYNIAFKILSTWMYFMLSKEWIFEWEFLFLPDFFV